MTSMKTEPTTTCADELETSWQVNRTLVECNRQMLQCHIACDVTFSVGPTQDTVEDIAAHKYMLVSRSPVFFAMFCGPMSETTTGGTIRVPDVEPDAFRHMLEYLYSDEVELSDDLVLPILYIGKKYIIPALTTKCTTYLEEHLHPDNVCLIYEQSLLYDETTLIEKCVLFIETRTEDVLHSGSFTDIPLALLTRILQFECLTISELELFQACLRWAQSECKRQNKDTCPRNKRKILGDAIYLIHFPSMSLKEFSRVVARSGILTAEEKCSVFEYLTCEEDCDSHALLFPVTPRQKPQPSILKRFSVFGKSNVYSGDCSIMKLQCDKPVIIKGFGVSASLNYDPLAEIQVTIKQDRTFMCNRSIPITEERSVDIMHVCLPECVIFKANTWYTIIVTFHFYGDHDQGSCRRGKGGSKTITFDGVTFEFDRADSAGFVPQILFCSA